VAHEDLVSLEWPDLDWSSEKVAASLDTAHAAVVARGKGARSWYLGNHKGKGRASKALRGISSICIGIAAVFPALSVANPSFHVATWGYVPLALAGGFYGADRVFGFSDAWMRYMVTAMRLGARLELADVQWEARRAARGTTPTPEAVQADLEHLRGLAEDLSDLVTAETEQWAKQIGVAMTALQAAAEAAKGR